MKKILLLCLILYFYGNLASALSIYDPISKITKSPYDDEYKGMSHSDILIEQQAEKDGLKNIVQPKSTIQFKKTVQPIKYYEPWVTDINAGKGHVTYTLNMYMPTKRGPLLFKNRRDYICSQDKEALLWGEATYVINGDSVDYTSLMDKTKLRKYAPVDEYNRDTIEEIRLYCK